AADAGLNAGEILSFAKEARETGSDTAALDRLRAVRTEKGSRIRELSLTGSSKPPVARQLRQHLGFVTKVVGPEQELVELNQHVKGQHAQAVKDAVAVLNAVLAVQPS